MTKHQSALARTYCDGFSPWGKCLAHLGLAARVDEIGIGPIIRKSYDPAGTFLVLAEPSAESLILSIFFRLKPGVTLSDIADGRTATELIADWRSVCAAFVRFEVDLSESRPLRCLDHDATEKAAHDLLSPTLLSHHEKFFDSLMVEVGVLLERYRCDHGIEEVSERYKQLLLLNHYQQR